jgi:hypothetical protein
MGGAGPRTARPLRALRGPAGATTLPAEIWQIEIIRPHHPVALPPAHLYIVQSVKKTTCTGCKLLPSATAAPNTASSATRPLAAPIPSDDSGYRRAGLTGLRLGLAPARLNRAHELNLDRLEACSAADAVVGRVPASGRSDWCLWLAWCPEYGGAVGVWGSVAHLKRALVP